VPGVKTVRLGTVAKMGSGGTPTSSIARYYGGSIPWVSISDMTSRGKYIRETDRTLTDEGLAASSARLYEADVVLYAMYASLGECSLAVGRVSSSQAILGISPGPKLDREYLYYYLQAMKPRVKLMGQQGTQANLNAGMVRAFEIPLPSLAEQSQIATALADADRRIEVLGQLALKRESIARGVMQQLLTGRTRLPGFTGEWHDAAVGELLTFKNGLNKASEFFGAGTPIVNFMDVMNGPIINSTDVTGLVTLTKEERKRFEARRGDLFFTRTSETVDEVGTVAVLVDDIPDASFSGFILRGRPSSAVVDSVFLARAFQLDAVRDQVTSSATYTTRALTNGRALGRIVISIPPVDEQRTIAAVISDFEAEIHALRSRLSKARAVKTAMLQQLMSRRAQLPVETSL
jgi:type I restriction enzyme S subunit